MKKQTTLDMEQLKRWIDEILRRSGLFTKSEQRVYMVEIVVAVLVEIIDFFINFLTDKIISKSPSEKTEV